MRVLCAWFPRLDVDLAIRQRPALSKRAVVLLQGHGDRAIVSGLSCEAGRLGILQGMSAGQARRKSPAAVFLADNSGACLQELERVAGIVRTRCTTRVEVGGRDHLFIAVESEDAEDDRAIALRLMGIIRAWADRPVRGGLAETRAEALEAAKSSRKGLLATPPSASLGEARSIAAFRDEEIVIRRELPSNIPGLGVRAAIGQALARAEAILLARGNGFRSIEVEVHGATHLAVRAASPQPCYTAEAMALIAPQLEPDELEGATGFEIRLARLAPDIRVRPLGAANFEPAVPLARAS